MTRFLVKCLLSVVLFCVVQIFIRQAIPYYAYEDLNKLHVILPPKIDYYRSHPEINTLFIGSSLVYHQIIPDTFDTYTGLKSLNLGVNGMVFFESSFFTEQILRKENLDNVEFLFFEVSTPSSILDNSIRPIRPHYFWDQKRTSLAIKLCYNLGRLKDLFPIIKSSAHRFFGIYNIRKLIAWNDRIEQDKPSTLLAKGFGALTFIFKEKTEFISCDSLTYRKEHPIIEKELNRLAKLCELKGITFIPIYINETFKCNRAEGDKRIVLGDFGHYPEYEDATLWFGPGHLNEKGARIFTKHFTNQFKQRFVNSQ